MLREVLPFSFSPHRMIVLNGGGNKNNGVEHGGKINEMVGKFYFPPISETPGGNFFSGGTTIKWGGKTSMRFLMYG